jgi:flagellar M-ring protein FliF
MAVGTGGAVGPSLTGFLQVASGRRLLTMLGAAALIAVIAAVWMWGQKPEYRVLFSNFSDRDGGAIVTALEQMNVPHRFAEGGGAILVPADRVHDARLKLASQGLPKGGNLGFELMENQKLGVSQFLEQVNFQRALEGELARSIQSVSAVAGARVHLALPKASVFVRDRQKPTASVLLNLHPGRTLDPQQVNAIVHLVASSVPDLTTQSVTVVDQHGGLLSEVSKSSSMDSLDAAQLKYIQELQLSVARRIESILTPIVGENNVHAEATADVDFSRSEQAAETYKPNQSSEAAAIRSQQTSEVQTPGGATAAGIPGALSNQPPGPATAPISTPSAAAPAAALATVPGPLPTSSPTNPNSSRKDATVNYEVDKTIRYIQQPMGGIKRLSVAVVVNYKKAVDESGKVTFRPLTDAENAQITDLVKEAMGFSKERGDSLNVVNSPFAVPEREPVLELPVWQQPEKVQIAKDSGKYLLVSGILGYLFFAYLRPMLRRVTEGVQAPLRLPASGGQAGDEIAEGQLIERKDPQPRSYQKNLEMARQLAREEPKMVANVVKTWVRADD